MEIAPAEISALLEIEISKVSDARVLNHISEMVVEPEQIVRQWDYGVPGESYPCWSVLKSKQSATGIAYFEYGFGPTSPWGLVNLPGSPDESMGMDSGWFPKLLYAYFDSLASELAIWRVFKEDVTGYPGIPITEEADWESAWDQAYRYRAADPVGRYHCWHSIRTRE